MDDHKKPKKHRYQHKAFFWSLGNTLTNKTKKGSRDEVAQDFLMDDTVR